MSTRKAYRVKASQISTSDLAFVLHYLIKVVELRVQPNEFIMIPRVELSKDVRELLAAYKFRETDLIGLPP
jgi:hypothetical protein